VLDVNIFLADASVAIFEDGRNEKLQMVTEVLIAE